MSQLGQNVTKLIDQGKTDEVSVLLRTVKDAKDLRAAKSAILESLYLGKIDEVESEKLINLLRMNEILTLAPGAVIPPLPALPNGVPASGSSIETPEGGTVVHRPGSFTRRHISAIVDYKKLRRVLGELTVDKFKYLHKSRKEDEGKTPNSYSTGSLRIGDGSEVLGGTIVAIIDEKHVLPIPGMYMKGTVLTDKDSHGQDLAIKLEDMYVYDIDVLEHQASLWKPIPGSQFTRFKAKLTRMFSELRDKAVHPEDNEETVREFALHQRPDLLEKPYERWRAAQLDKFLGEKESPTEAVIAPLDPNTPTNPTLPKDVASATGKNAEEIEKITKSNKHLPQLIKRGAAIIKYVNKRPSEKLVKKTNVFMGGDIVIIIPARRMAYRLLDADGMHWFIKDGTLAKRIKAPQEVVTVRMSQLDTDGPEWGTLQGPQLAKFTQRLLNGTIGTPEWLQDELK